MSKWAAALVGNPNTGKTSLFNALTRSYEYVGNWTGVTVEKKVGQLRDQGGQLIDLPGIYSLQPISKDEGVAVQYLIDEQPDAVLNVIDASQLERNLYLTIQLLEYGAPMIVALNMNDVAEGRGYKTKERVLASRLHVPVIKVNARRNQGIPTLISYMKEGAADKSDAAMFKLDYGPQVEQAITELVKLMPEVEHLSSRWLALQYMENNKVVQQWVHERSTAAAQAMQQIQADTERQLQDSHAALHLAQHIRTVRMQFIRELLAEAVSCTKKSSTTLTDRIDAIVTNRWLGIPIFMLVMYIMFKVTFEWIGAPLSDLLEAFFGGPLTDWLTQGLEAIGASEFTRAMLVDGILAGVGGVLVFVPQILILFLFISFVEDSGYMARVTLVMDRLMEAVGLNGKAFIPFIIGFGCNVPGIMAARSMEQPRERLVTSLLVPFMSCSARLPVYALFAGVFFTSHQALVVLSLYALGIVLTLVLAKLFTKVLMKGEHPIFVIELPPYRMPQWRTLFRSTWEKGKGFVRKAGTLILGGSVLIWLMSYMGPGGFNVDMDNSYLAMAGGIIAPLLAPLGFGTWQAGASLVTGFMAKEIVVSTMNIIYKAPDMTLLAQEIEKAFTPVSAYTFCVFVLLYIPCLATVGVLRKETSSWKWTFFAIGYALITAYIVALIVRLIGLGLGYV